MSNTGSRFAVDLGEVKLDPLTEKQVETEIRAVVMKALAGGVGASPSFGALTRFEIERFPDGTMGMVLDPQDDPTTPFGWRRTSSGPSRKVTDELRQKFSLMLLALDEAERDAVVRLLGEALPAKAKPVSPQTRKNDGLNDWLVQNANYAIAFWAGVAGHFAGGGSLSDVPVQEIADEAQRYK